MHSSTYARIQAEIISIMAVEAFFSENFFRREIRRPKKIDVDFGRRNLSGKILVSSRGCRRPISPSSVADDFMVISRRGEK